MNFYELCTEGIFLNLSAGCELCKTDDNPTEVLFSSESYRNPLSMLQRKALSILIGLLVSIAISANVLALLTIHRRKHQVLYKACLSSQALSDLLMAIFVGVDLLDKFTHDTIAWRLGWFMCGFVPYITTICALVSSTTLTCIAVDRCQGIVMLREKWNPSLLVSFLTVTCIWLAAGGISVPSFLDYYYAACCALDLKACRSEYANICLASVNENSNHFTAVFVIIFLPLLTAFVGLYSVIANFMWTKRKFPGTFEQSSTTAETNLENVSAGPNQVSEVKPAKESSQRVSKKTQYTEKKVRTIKIILIIMASFIVCRLPQWIFIVVSVHPDVHLTSNPWWVAKYLFSALSLSNSAVNPFIYSFLSETVLLTQRISGLCGKRLKCKKSKTFDPYIVKE